MEKEKYMKQVSNPKIAIVGAGAVGSVIGGLLARKGENVTLVARKAHVEAIHANGLHMDGASGKFIVRVPAKEELEFKPDLVFLAVKTQDVESTCRQIKPYILDAPVVTLQNGIRSDAIAADVLGRANIVSGVVFFNAGLWSPGHVIYGVKGAVLLGEAFQKNGKRVGEIAAVLRRVIKTEVHDNIYGAHWTKLLVNVMGNSLEAMTGLSFGKCMRNSGMRRIGIVILREAFEVMEKAGVKLEPLPGLPISAFKLTVKSPVGVASWILRLTMSGTNPLTSTLQSIRRGRPTEIDYLNGEIVAQGKMANMATPYNSMVVELIHEIERTHQFYSPSQLEKLFSK
jgi:2-dehydropantoate 2-reductase